MNRGRGEPRAWRRLAGQLDTMGYESGTGPAGLQGFKPLTTRGVALIGVVQHVAKRHSDRLPDSHVRLTPESTPDILEGPERYSWGWGSIDYQLGLRQPSQYIRLVQSRGNGEIITFTHRIPPGVQSLPAGVSPLDPLTPSLQLRPVSTEI